MNAYMSIYALIGCTCTHVCGTENSVWEATVLSKEMSASQKWFDRSQAGSIFGPKAYSFSQHINLFISTSQEETEDMCVWQLALAQFSTAW